MYHQIEVEDEDNVDMISHFHTCIDFIENAILKNGNVLVHWYVSAGLNS